MRLLNAARSARRPLAGLVLTAALALGVVAVPAAPAQAATVDGKVSSATLNWGVKKSFRDYLGRTFVGGKITPDSGAKLASNGALSFPSGSGTVLGGKGTVTFKGGVRFTGHHGQMNLRLSDFKVKLTGPTTGVLYADAKAPAAPAIKLKAVSLNNAQIASLKFASVKISGSKLNLSNAKVTLSASGKAALAGFYPAGTVMDPLSVTGKYSKRLATKTAVSAPSFKKGAKATTTVNVSRLSNKKYATGTVKVTWTIGGKVKSKSYTLKASHKGKFKVTAPASSRSSVKVKAAYAGSTTVAPSTSKTVTLKAR